MPQKKELGTFIWNTGNTSINDNIRNLLKEKHLYTTTEFGHIFIKMSDGFYRVHHELIDAEMEEYSVFIYKGTQVKNVYQIYY